VSLETTDRSACYPTCTNCVATLHETNWKHQQLQHSNLQGASGREIVCTLSRSLPVYSQFFNKMKWNCRQLPKQPKICMLIISSLIAKDPQELQDIVKELHTETGIIRLKMNKTKTKTQFANTTTQSNIMVDNESLD